MDNRRHFPLHIYSLHWCTCLKRPNTQSASCSHVLCCWLSLMVSQGTHTARSWQQLCWTLESFKSTAKSWPPSSSKSNKLSLQWKWYKWFVHSIPSLTRKISASYRWSEGHRSVTLGQACAWGCPCCGRPPRQLLLLTWKLSRKKEAYEIDTCCLWSPFWAGMISNTLCFPSSSVEGKS